MALSTLAAQTLTSQQNGDTLTEKAFMTSAVMTWALSGFTPVVNDGPVTVGIAYSDYTDAEIEEWYEQSGSWEQASLVGQEIGRRQIKVVGTFRIPPNTTTDTVIVLNHGNVVKTRVKWQLFSGQTISVWAYNEGSSALTTGSVINNQGHCNLWPN